MSSKIVKILIKAPASIANLGAGFDCLALALNLENDFALYVDLEGLTERLDKEFEIDISGRYENVDPKMRNIDSNLYVRSFENTRKFLWYRLGKIGNDVPKCPLYLCEDVRVPPIRGLGSSSSACVAGVVGAFEFMKIMYPKHRFQEIRDDPDLYASLAMSIEPCPDNICASLSGGLTYAFVEEQKTRRDNGPKRLHFFRQDIDDPDLRIVALVPSVPLETTRARGELEKHQYTHKQAAFNISRSTCIPEVFRSKRYELLEEVMKDSIHQKQRAQALYTDDRTIGMDLQHIFDEVVSAGAYSACIGGAGSTLVAFVHASKVQPVKQAFRAAFEEEAKTGWQVHRVIELKPNNSGTIVDVSENPERLPDVVASWAEHASEERAVRHAAEKSRRPEPGKPKDSTSSPRHGWLPDYRKGQN